MYDGRNKGRDRVKTAGGVMAPQRCRDGEGVGTCPLGPPEGGSVKWLGCGLNSRGTVVIETQLSASD